jgi:cardiolipin synthase
MLRNAQDHVFIMSPYFIPGTEITKKMRAAAARGVKITLILSGISDVPLAKSAERFMYAWLLRHQIQIYEYQPNVLHGKLASYDGTWFTIGSYNVNNLSAYASIELNLDVLSARIALDVEKQLQRIITDDCIQITLEKLNASTKLFEKLQWWLSYQLMRASLYVTTFYFRQQE